MKEVKKMNCAWCGKEFEKELNRKYCTQECAKKAQYAKIKQWISVQKALKYGDILQCKHCGNDFPYSMKNKKYCSYECESADKRYTGHTQSKQICWTCQNACGGCSWSSELKPVKGWKAKPTRIKCEFGRYRKSYKIIFCPEYIPDDD
jgi:hypothetical protein